MTKREATPRPPPARRVRTLGPAIRVIASLVLLGGCIDLSGGGSVVVEQCTPDGKPCELDSDCCSNTCKGDPSGDALQAGTCGSGGAAGSSGGTGGH